MEKRQIQKRHPAQKIRAEIESIKKGNGLQFCFAYYRDIEESYAFYCARYENISYKEFLNLGLEEFCMKLSSIPENEPLFKVMRSRTINVSSIKDKEERKYWNRLKSENRIPDIYLPTEYINKRVMSEIKPGGYINDKKSR
jgi:hypothetical protein